MPDVAERLLMHLLVLEDRPERTRLFEHRITRALEIG
jgi:hypothetical protein